MIADTEVRVTSATGGQKGAKPQRYDLIPTLPLRLLAEQYGKGAEKYERVNGKDNWRNGYDWSLSYAAIQRHLNQFWAGEDLDEETGTPHPIAAAWHCFALVTFMFDDELRSKYDDRQDKAEAPGGWVQRYIAGVDVANPDHMTIFDRQTNRIWAIPDDEMKFGTFKPWDTASTEKPEPIGCIVTVTGDDGRLHHEIDTGATVVIERDDYLLDGSYLCRPLVDGGFPEWVAAEDLA